MNTKTHHFQAVKIWNRIRMIRYLQTNPPGQKTCWRKRAMPIWYGNGNVIDIWFGRAMMYNSHSGLECHRNPKRPPQKTSSPILKLVIQDTGNPLTSNIICTSIHIHHPHLSTSICVYPHLSKLINSDQRWPTVTHILSTATNSYPHLLTSINSDPQTIHMYQH